MLNGAASPNPAYAPWRRQDRLLYSSMIGSISLAVQSVVSSANTTKEVWTTLATTFGNASRGHIRQLKLQIERCVKGTNTISEYLRLIKSKSANFALLGKPMDHEDLIERIHAGLGEDYKPEVDAIHGRDTTISYAELHERLLNREAIIMSTESAPATPIVAHATDTRQTQNNNQQWRRNKNNHNNQARQHHNNNQQRFSKPYLGRCQACNTQGHSNRYCPAFRLVLGATQNQHAHTQQRNPGPWNNVSPFQQWPPTANPAMMSDSSTWLLDSGASHHMTSDLANLSMHNPYSGGDGVLLGDGSGLNISHSGSLSLPSYTRPFFLNKVLCVPALEKILSRFFNYVLLMELLLPLRQCIFR